MSKETTALDRLKPSKLKLVFLSLFGKEGAVFDYLIGLANTAIAMIPSATMDKLRGIREKLERIHAAILALDWALPPNWVESYETVNRCLAAVLDTLDDSRLTREEIADVTAAFQLAYADWAADDTAPEKAE